ncbi:MAG: FAD-binding oxidoreductase, partial [Chloroflexota bacterium]|nr:FAD-binding oxidoreductase [Chloroflexota bacterium]
IAQGASGDGAGGFRQQFSTPINVRMTQLSLPYFLDAPARLGAEVEARKQGYLFLLTDETSAAAFRQGLVMQRGLGAPARWLEPEEVAALVPGGGLRTDDLVGATYCPDDGWARPPLVAAAFARRAEALGARVFEGCPVTGVLVERGTARGVRIRRDEIRAPVVLDAAGPQAAEIAAMAGIDLPAAPVCRQVFRTAPFEGYPPDAPLTIDVASGLWFRPHEGGFWWGKSDEAEPPGLTKHLDPDWARHVAALARGRAPAFARARVVGGWSGFYMMTPDGHALIGSFPEVKGFYCATGFSGHGFQHSPATGLLLAEIILDGAARTLDIHALRPTRFAEGEPIVEQYVV